MTAFTTSDGVNLHVVDELGASAGSVAVTLVLVHGWTVDHTSWDEVAAAVPGTLGRNVRVLRYDLRGHGRSDPAPKGAATMDRLADDLAELIEARVPDGPVVLAGHSMGGMTMMALAQRHPRLVTERVAGVAFVGTTSGGLSELNLGLPRWIAAPIMLGERFVNLGIARLRRPAFFAKRHRVMRPGLRWLLFGRSPKREHIALTAAQVGRCHPRSMIDFRNELNEHERLHALPVFRGIPAVVLAGGRDRLCPVRHARVITDALPGARLHLYPGVGHMINYERAPEVTAHLATLIAGAAGLPGQTVTGKLSHTG